MYKIPPTQTCIIFRQMPGLCVCMSLSKRIYLWERERAFIRKYLYPARMLFPLFPTTINCDLNIQGKIDTCAIEWNGLHVGVRIYSLKLLLDLSFSFVKDSSRRWVMSLYFFLFILRWLLLNQSNWEQGLYGLAQRYIFVDQRKWLRF